MNAAMGWLQSSSQVPCALYTNTACNLDFVQVPCSLAWNMLQNDIFEVLNLALAPTGQQLTGWTPIVVTPDGDIFTGQKAAWDVQDDYYVMQNEIPVYTDIYGNIGLLDLVDIGGGGAANNGTHQQPQNQQPSRLKDCAKAYYGFNTLPGAAQDATRLALIPAAPIIPKAAVGVPQALGSGPLTNLLSYFSLGSGTAASGANIFRAAGRIGAPIAIASAVIDATAIGICASYYQGWLPHF